MNQFIRKNKEYLYCILVSFCILLFTSKNSFLYPINDWMDANAFFTVGKGIFRGVIPYKDVFEQKGLILYFIYGIGSLLCYKSFHGVFIIEVVSFSIYLWYSYKVIDLLGSKRSSFIILPILSFFICTSRYFVHGGSAEEFCLPYLGVSLYYFVRHFKEKMLSHKELFLNGCMAGIVFMIKYSITGFWIGFIFMICLYSLLSKNIKKAIIDGLWFILGMLIPIVICCSYLFINGGLKDFIEQYFIVNMTAYEEEYISIVQKFIRIFGGSYASLYHNGWFVLIIMLGSLGSIMLLKNTKMYLKISLLVCILFSIIGLYWGLKFFYYYGLPLVIFGIFIFIFLLSYLDKYFISRRRYFIYFIVFILSVVLSYFHANYKEQILSKKEDYFQFKYAEYMDKDATLLNMGYLDAGLYTVSGILPNTKFFEVQNISYDKYPDNLDDMEYNVKNKNIKYILFFTKRDISYVEKNYSYIYDSYDLVFDDKQEVEHEIYHAYLYELKS